MKTSLLMLAFFAVTISLKAQINKGQWLVGGNANYSHVNTKNSSDNTSSNTNKSSTFQLMPDAGYFFINQLCAGIRAGIGRSNLNYRFIAPNYLTQYESNITTLALSPFIRYYFLPSSHKINILADVSYSYNHNINSSKSTMQYIDATSQLPVVSTNSDKSKTHTNGYTFAAGPALFLNPKVSLELTVGYSFSKSEARVFNSFIAGAGFQIHLGK